ncbi:hypothetical protein ABES25_05140 [Bacillus gobiensis]
MGFWSLVSIKVSLLGGVAAVITGEKKRVNKQDSRSKSGVFSYGLI